MTKTEMNTEIRHHDFVFSPDFARADRSDGSSVTFTRSESRALSAMAESAGRLLTRNQLLDAVSEPGSEKNDRNVDFLINRIRRKLGDSAKDPRFIATRYGEGYVWVAAGRHVVEDHSDAFLIIGPFRGTDILEGGTAVANDIARELAAQISPLLRPEQQLAIVPDFAPDGTGTAEGPTVSVDLTFFRGGGKTECVVSGKSVRSHRVHYVNRFDLPTPVSRVADLRDHIAAIAPMLLAKSWAADADTATDQLPLPVAMHEATRQPVNGETSWPENDVRLRALRVAHPRDPSIKLLYATHLHTKYLILGRDLFYKGEDTCEVDEAEIEQLVLDALDYAQSRPDHAIMAAKLLYFVDQGYKNLALEIVEEALRNGASVASSLSMVGQFRGFIGDIDGAVDSLSQAKALSEPGSHHYLYVLIMLCQALMAGGRREQLAVERADLYKASSLGAVFFEPIFSDPYAPSLRAKGVTLMLSRARATGLLKQLHYVSARLYEQPTHRENALRTPINLFVRRFGPDVVPDNIKASVAGLFPAP